MDSQKIQSFGDWCRQAQKIVVIQANNPDGDSLASSLALESLLGAQGKEVVLYCASPMPEYLKFLTGHDRVTDRWPNNYDLAIMVDNSAQKLIDQKICSDLRTRSFVILDHHPTQTDIDYSDLCLNIPQMAATGQIIYTLADKLGWTISELAAGYLASSLLSDTLGFSSQIMKDNPAPLEVMAQLVRLGVNLSELHDRRLEYQKIEVELVAYKGRLLERIEFLADGRLASLTIPQAELKIYGSRYNPTIVLDDLRLVRGVKLTIGFKEYTGPDGQINRLTARLRCHEGCQIAQKLAEDFGGGGHPYAAGIKWVGQALDTEKIKQEVYVNAQKLLDTEAQSWS